MFPACRSSGRRSVGALIVLLLSGLCAAAETPAQASPTPQASLVTVASFNGANGAEPHAGVTFDRQGNLFGTTNNGGPNNDGTVFEIANGSTRLITLASFRDTDGSQPGYGHLTFDSLGDLFGTTESGGMNDAGTVYEIAKGSTHIKTLASFNGTIGAEPVVSKTFDSQGNLFATPVKGNTNNNGAFPVDAVTFDRQGNLFGTTFKRGTNDAGTVFEIVKGSKHIKTLATFNYMNGSEPVSSVTFDRSGNLFGTTGMGGASNCGTVYEIAKGSTRIRTLVSFNSINGDDPAGAVTFDRSGNLFGTTAEGGAGILNGHGAVFEIAKGSTRLKTLAAFNGANGDEPDTDVTFDRQGNLFGTTAKGGAKNLGTVFEIAKGSTRIKTLVSFNGTNGANPSNVTFDSSGNLFGTTQSGGAGGRGTVFEIVSVGSHPAAPGSSSAAPKPHRRAVLLR